MSLTDPTLENFDIKSWNMIVVIDVSHRKDISLPNLGVMLDLLWILHLSHCYKISVIMLVLLFSFRFEQKKLYYSNCLYKRPYWRLSYYIFSSCQYHFLGKNSNCHIVTFMCNSHKTLSLFKKKENFKLSKVSNDETWPPEVCHSNYSIEM